jgi:hypothetical protein
MACPSHDAGTARHRPGRDRGEDRAAQCVVREGLHDLLGRPVRGGVLGHVEVEDPPAMVSEHDEDAEHSQARAGDREQVDGHQVPDVVGEERPPALGRRGAPLREHPGDVALGHVDAELEELAMDSRGCPEGIRRGQACDQGLDLGADGRAAPGGPVGELRPVLAKAAPLPAQNGLGGSQSRGGASTGPRPWPARPKRGDRSFGAWAGWRLSCTPRVAGAGPGSRGRAGGRLGGLPPVALG